MKRVLLVLALAAAGSGLWWWFGHDRSAEAQAQLEALVAQAQARYDDNDHESSAELYGRAAALARSAGDERMAVAYSAQRGVCLKMAGHPSDARVELLPALTAARLSGDRRTEGLALGNLAKIEGTEGNDALALDYLEQLAALAREISDPRLETQTLEQAAMHSLGMGLPHEALLRIDRALAVNASNLPEDDRRDALLRQRATVMVQLGDVEGAVEAWSLAAQAPVALANQALLLADLSLHVAAAELALEAARLFEQEGDLRRRERDEALLLSLSELLRAGEYERVERGVAAVLDRQPPELAAAPFVVLSGRLALAQGRAAEAAEHLLAAQAVLADGDNGAPVAWLAAVALGAAGQHAQAEALLLQQPDCLARTVVLGWLTQERPPARGLALDLLPLLGARSPPDDDRSLTVLERTCPLPLPSLAWLALHHHLADRERQLTAGRQALADAALREGAIASLRWQFLEARRRLTGSWPDGGVPQSSARWIKDRAHGRMSDDEGLLAVIPGELVSYLVISTSSLAASTFGLPPADDLLRLVDGVSAGACQPLPLRRDQLT